MQSDTQNDTFASPGTQAYASAFKRVVFFSSPKAHLQPFKKGLQLFILQHETDNTNA